MSVEAPQGSAAEAPSPGVSRHKCLIYEGHPSEQLPVIVPLLMDGLRENRRCLYLGDPETVVMVRAALAVEGVDVEREAGRGALIFSSDRGHLAGGGFDPAAMVEMLRGLIDRAVSDGFSGLWATGDMRWELGDDRNFERLREYEARLELVFREKPLSGVCQYHRATVPARAVQDALATHQAAYVGRALNKDNLFYIPPELHLQDGAARREELADWMWRQVARVARAEEERDRSLRELAELNRVLEERVRERTADLEAFGYSLSHDLRAPLRAIDGFCRAIVAKYADKLGSAGEAEFGRVLSAAARMYRLIDALQELFELRRRGMAVETVDLSRAARDIAAELAAAEPERRVAVAIQPDLRVRGDSRLLGTALANLLSNAWKFTAKTPDARVEFGARSRNGAAAFFVRDNGAGFDMAHVGRLFQAFQRLHPAEEFPGNGIGLAVVARVVSRHGGSVWAESAPGRGAAFYFTVPGLPEPAPAQR